MEVVCNLLQVIEEIILKYVHQKNAVKPRFDIMSIPILILLLDGAPSVPKDMQIPASSISFMGANPSILIAAAGQWDTFTPAFERKPI